MLRYMVVGAFFVSLTYLTLWWKCCSNQFKVLDKFHKILDNRSKLVFILHRRSA